MAFYHLGYIHEGTGRLKAQVVLMIDDPAPEHDRRDVALTRCPEACDDTKLAVVQTPLVRVRYDRGVEERCSLNGVLKGKIGTYEKPLLPGQGFSVDSHSFEDVGYTEKMALENPGYIAVPLGKVTQHVAE
jgi:hypothetical protein